MKKISEMHESIAKHYEKLFGFIELFSNPNNQENIEIRRTIEENILKGSTITDFGCGVGHTTLDLIAKYNVQFVDSSIVLSKLPSGLEKYEKIEDSKPADCIICKEMLAHILTEKELKEVFSSIKEQLKENGTLIIVDTFFEDKYGNNLPTFTDTGMVTNRGKKLFMKRTWEDINCKISKVDMYLKDQIDELVPTVYFKFWKIDKIVTMLIRQKLKVKRIFNLDEGKYMIELKKNVPMVIEIKHNEDITRTDASGVTVIRNTSSNTEQQLCYN